MRSGQGLRPDVRIHVSAAEVAFWTSPDFSHTAMPKPVPAVLRSTAKSFYDSYRAGCACSSARTKSLTAWWPASRAAIRQGIAWST